MLKLIILNGDRKGRKITVSDDAPVPIGRSHGRLRLHDSRVSKEHAEITFDGESWILRDLGSANGSYLNKKSMRGMAELERGDVIQFGRVALRVRQADGWGVRHVDAPEVVGGAEAVAPPPMTAAPVRDEPVDEVAAPIAPAAEPAGVDTGEGGDDDFDLDAMFEEAERAEAAEEIADDEETVDHAAAEPPASGGSTGYTGYAGSGIATDDDTDAALEDSAQITDADLASDGSSAGGILIESGVFDPAPAAGAGWDAGDAGPIDVDAPDTDAVETSSIDVSDPPAESAAPPAVEHTTEQAQTASTPVEPPLAPSPEDAADNAADEVAEETVEENTPGEGDSGAAAAVADVTPGDEDDAPPTDTADRIQIDDELPDAGKTPGTTHVLPNETLAAAAGGDRFAALADDSTYADTADEVDEVNDEDAIGLADDPPDSVFDQVIDESLGATYPGGSGLSEIDALDTDEDLIRIDDDEPTPREPDPATDAAGDKASVEYTASIDADVLPMPAGVDAPVDELPAEATAGDPHDASEDPPSEVEPDPQAVVAPEVEAEDEPAAKVDVADEPTVEPEDDADDTDTVDDADDADTKAEDDAEDMEDAALDSESIRAEAFVTEEVETGPIVTDAVEAETGEAVEDADEGDAPAPAAPAITSEAEEAEATDSPPAAPHPGLAEPDLSGWDDLDDAPAAEQPEAIAEPEPIVEPEPFSEPFLDDSFEEDEVAAAPPAVDPPTAEPLAVEPPFLDEDEPPAGDPGATDFDAPSPSPLDLAPGSASAVADELDRDLAADQAALTEATDDNRAADTPGDDAAAASPGLPDQPTPGVNPTTVVPPQEPRSSYRSAAAPKRAWGKQIAVAAAFLAVAALGVLLYAGVIDPDNITGRFSRNPEPTPPPTNPTSPGPESDDPAAPRNPGPGLTTHPNQNPGPDPGLDPSSTDTPPTQTQTHAAGLPVTPDPFAHGPRVLGAAALTGRTTDDPNVQHPTRADLGPTTDTPPGIIPFPPLVLPDPGGSTTPDIDNPATNPATNPGTTVVDNTNNPDPTPPDPIDPIPPTDGDKLVFLVDCSGSLVDSLPRMLHWLREAIDTLGPSETFTIIFFKKDQAIETEPAGLQPLTRAYQRRLNADWLDPDNASVFPTGRSDPAAALALALTYNPSDIYLLSDDAFAQRTGDTTPDQAVDLVANALGSTDVRVHGVQFFYDSGDSALQALSEQFDGTYEFVAETRHPDQDPIDLLEELENRNDE